MKTRDGVFICLDRECTDQTARNIDLLKGSTTDWWRSLRSPSPTSTLGLLIGTYKDLDGDPLMTDRETARPSLLPASWMQL